MFHIGIDIDRMATDCVLIDQAEPGAAATYLMAGAMAAKDRPADGVLAGLAGLAEAAGLGQRELLARTTQFRRGSGQKQLDFKVLRIQLIGAPGPELDQQELWRKFLVISDQLMGRGEHPRHQGYRKWLGLGCRARGVLAESVVGLLTEIVWSGALPPVSGPGPGAGVGGGYGRGPSLGAWDRYVSMAEVIRLLDVAGSARNVFAAFFLGEVDKVTGPVSLAVLGSPGAPLAAGEVAALVARLNAVPAAERRRLRISLFTDAAQEEIGRLLAEPGADIVAVWTAGAASQAGVPAETGLPSARAAVSAA